ncbi:MAG: hypothetical protein ABSA77_09335 [Thermoguttaceae bacterium]
MKRFATNYLPLWLIFSLLFSPAHAADNYKNFKVAVYVRAQEVQQMKNPDWLAARWNVLEKQVHVDKVYLETFRDRLVPDEEAIAKAKQFFNAKGIKTAGGIATVRNERNHLQSFCYTTPEDRQKLKKLIQLTARHFDEIILDDFFFTSCKCESCIKAKGERTWTQFRLALMEEVSRDLVIQPAKEINPKVKLIIKYPNWYDHYQGLGYNLEAEPKLFDEIYTGTETRDPVFTQQHLQQYQSYLIMRYLNNVKPGGKGGGWVDPYNRQYLDRYAEQLWLTLFAKTPEITLFSFGQLIEPVRQDDGSSGPDTMVGRTAGFVFDQADGFLGKLGKPLGLMSYKPYNSSGEDFLHNYIGMLGIPLELTPEFPADAKVIFLTESAKFDPAIVEKIKGQLTAGKNVVITSGLLRALQGKGIEDIVELRISDKKVLSREFWQRSNVYRSEKEILFPQIEYITNDAWDLLSCMSQGNGYPILLEADYAKGILYVLTIPDNFAELYGLPSEVLTIIKEVMARDLPVRVEGPSGVSLFVYDNDTFIVESFLPHTVEVKIVVNKGIATLNDLMDGRGLGGFPGRGMTGQPRGDKVVFETFIAPHSYRVFSAEPAHANKATE